MSIRQKNDIVGRVALSEQALWGDASELDFYIERESAPEDGSSECHAEDTASENP